MAEYEITRTICEEDNFISYDGKYVSYSCDLDEDDIDDIAFEGKCIIYEKSSHLFGNGEGFMSDILINPTNRQLMYIADKLIEKTEDYHHTFYEGLHIIKEISKDIYEAELMLGS